MAVTKSYEFILFGAMAVTKPYAFIWFGALDVTKPYEFIRFAAMAVTKPYEFILSGAMVVTKPYELIKFRAMAVTATASTRTLQRRLPPRLRQSSSKSSSAEAARPWALQPRSGSVGCPACRGG